MHELKSSSNDRWLITIVLYVFIFLYAADKIIIGLWMKFTQREYEFDTVHKLLDRPSKYNQCTRKRLGAKGKIQLILFKFTHAKFKSNRPKMCLNKGSTWLSNAYLEATLADQT